MSVKLRIELEKQIAKIVIDDLLAAGFGLGVNDGEEDVLGPKEDEDEENMTPPCFDADTVLAAMFSTDEDYLFVYKDNKTSGWVRFIYGNSGYDVINDYAGVLEPFMKNAQDFCEKYSD